MNGMTHVLPTRTNHYEKQFNTLKIKPTLEYHKPKTKRDITLRAACKKMPLKSPLS